MLRVFKRGPLFVLHTSKNLGNKKALARSPPQLPFAPPRPSVGQPCVQFRADQSHRPTDRPLESAKRVGNVPNEWGPTRGAHWAEFDLTNGRPAPLIHDETKPWSIHSVFVSYMGFSGEESGVGNRPRRPCCCCWRLRLLFFTFSLGVNASSSCLSLFLLPMPKLIRALRPPTPLPATPPPPPPPLGGPSAASGGGGVVEEFCSGKKCVGEGRHVHMCFLSMFIMNSDNFGLKIWHRVKCPIATASPAANRAIIIIISVISKWLMMAQ